MNRIRRTLFLSVFVLIGLLSGAEAATAQEAISTFHLKLWSSRWDTGLTRGAFYGGGVAICPEWWPWPRRPRGWRGPWPPKPSFEVSSHEIEERGIDRVTSFELGVQQPLSDASRVIPYVEGGIGYYIIDGDAPGIGNEIGGHVALGGDIRLGDRWGLSLEATYREIRSDLDLSGPVFKAGFGVSF